MSGPCIECLMAWLLFGDGAKCLAGHGRVYFVPKGENDAN